MKNGTHPVMEYKRQNVTPQAGAKMLERNKGNRDIRQHRVDYFVDLLTRGEFKCTHQGIAIAPDGNLLDGQHRLWAIVTSGIAADMMVAHNVDPDTYTAIDTAAKKTNADLLRVDRRITEVAGFIIKFVHSVAAGPDRVGKALDGPVGQAIRTLVQGHQTTKARVSAVPIKAAVVARMLDIPANTNRLCELYRAFVARDYPSLNKSTQSFLRQIDDTARVRPGDAHQIFIRAWRAFDVEKPHLAKLTIKDSEVVADEVRAVLSRFLPKEKVERSAGRKIKEAVARKAAADARLAR
jgi:hypothetical protein